MQEPTVKTDCDIYKGPKKLYQNFAANILESVGRPQPHWAWVTQNCGNETCLAPEHLIGHAPVSLAYPRGLCIYCGKPGFTRDHLLPRRWSGDAKRHFVVIVPACGTCNTVLNDTLTWSITERRALCHARLRRKYAKILRIPDWSEEELREFGSDMRGYIEDGMAKKQEVLEMLDWPTDPSFDARALGHSGIENPYTIGLLIEEDDELRKWARRVA